MDRTRAEAATAAKSASASAQAAADASTAAGAPSSARSASSAMKPPMGRTALAGTRRTASSLALMRPHAAAKVSPKAQHAPVVVPSGDVDVEAVLHGRWTRQQGGERSGEVEEGGDDDEASEEPGGEPEGIHLADAGARNGSAVVGADEGEEEAFARATLADLPAPPEVLPSGLPIIRAPATPVCPSPIPLQPHSANQSRRGGTYKTPRSLTISYALPSPYAYFARFAWLSFSLGHARPCLCHPEGGPARPP